MKIQVWFFFPQKKDYIPRILLLYDLWRLHADKDKWYFIIHASDIFFIKAINIIIKPPCMHDALQFGFSNYKIIFSFIIRYQRRL